MNQKILSTLIITSLAAVHSPSIQAQQYKMIFSFGTDFFETSGADSNVENIGEGEVFFFNSHDLNLLNKEGELIAEELDTYSGSSHSQLAVNNNNDKLYYLNGKYAHQYSINDDFKNPDTVTYEDWWFGDGDGRSTFRSVDVDDETGVVVLGYNYLLDTSGYDLEYRFARLTPSGSGNMKKSANWEQDLPRSPWSVATSPTGKYHLAGAFERTHFLFDESPYENYPNISKLHTTKYSLNSRNRVEFLSNGLMLMASGKMQLRDPNSDYDILWENNTLNDSAEDIVVSDDDSIFIAGRTTVKRINPATDLSLTDSQREVWSYELKENSVGSHIDVDSHNNVYVSTQYGDVLKINSEGKKVWEYSDPEGLQISGIAVHEP